MYLLQYWYFTGVLDAQYTLFFRAKKFGDFRGSPGTKKSTIRGRGRGTVNYFGFKAALSRAEVKIFKVAETCLKMFLRPFWWVNVTISAIGC